MTTSETTTYKVLDHGYVKYIGHLGTDEDIVESARLSTGRGFVSWDPYRRCNRCERVDDYSYVGKCACGFEDYQLFPRGDFGLLNTLYSNKHMTPFEMCSLVIEVQAPIMVFREWHRHRTQKFNEFSARYAQMPNLHYLPELSRIQKQSKSNKQGSDESFPEEDARLVLDALSYEQREVYDSYDGFVKAGVAKEVARLNTPVSRYSKMRAKTDLRNWLGFLMLRMAPGAQWEIRQYANVVANLIQSLWPKTYSLFEEHDLHGVHLSKTERYLLNWLLQYSGTDSMNDDQKKTFKSLQNKLKP